MNMIGAMRGGQLPTQLIFGLSALTIHGYEPVVAALLPARRRTATIRYLDRRRPREGVDTIKDVGEAQSRASRTSS